MCCSSGTAELDAMHRTPRGIPECRVLSRTRPVTAGGLETHTRTSLKLSSITEFVWGEKEVIFENTMAKKTCSPG